MITHHLYAPNESDRDAGGIHKGPMICGAATRRRTVNSQGGQYPMNMAYVPLIEGFQWCPKCLERLPLAKLAAIEL